MNHDFFFSKNRKNISPTFAQERLVKNQVLFLVGHTTQIFSFYLLCWPKQKKEVSSGMNFAYELWLFFPKKNNKNISPNFATLQTQERLVKNQILFLVGHTTQIFLFTYCVDQNKRKKFLLE